MMDIPNKISFFYEYTGESDFNVIDSVTNSNNDIIINFSKKDEEVVRVVSEAMSESESITQQVYASSQLTTTNQGWKVFDYNDTDVNKCWISNGIPSNSNPEFIELQFKAGPVIIDRYSIQNRFSDEASLVASPKKWFLQGSNDNGQSWVDLHSVDNSINDESNSKTEYVLEHREEYSSYRLFILDRNGSSNYCAIQTLELIVSPYNYQKSLGPYQNDFTLVNGISSITLNDFDLTITTNNGDYVFEDFIIEPTYTDSNAIGVGLKSSVDNTFKPIVSNTVMFIENDKNEVVFTSKEFEAETTGPIGTLTGTFLTFTVSGDVEGFYTVDSDNEEKYRIVPFNGLSGISGITLNPDGSFKILPGRYYIDFSLVHGVAETGQAILVNLTTDEIIHYSVGYTNQFPGIKKTNMSVLTGYIEILTNDDYAIKVLGTDLGSYYIDEALNSYVISTCNIYLVKRFDFAIKPVLLDLITENEYDYSPISILPAMSSDSERDIELSASHVYTNHYPYTAINGNINSSITGWVGDAVASEENPVYFNIKYKNGPKTLSEYSFTNLTLSSPNMGNVINRMTSDNSAGQIATAVEIYSTDYRAWKAFNGTNSNATDCWLPRYTRDNNWLGIEFLNGPVTINKYSITNRNYSSVLAISRWYLQGKMKTDTAWTTIGSTINNVNGTINAVRYFELDGDYTYDMFRLNVVGYGAIAELSFYNSESELYRNANVVSWDLEGRNSDNEEWTLVDRRLNDVEMNPTVVRSFKLNSPVSFSEYRFKITNSNNAYAALGNVYFFEEPIPSLNYTMTSSTSSNNLTLPWQTRAKNSIRLETSADVWASTNGNITDPQWLEMELNERVTIDAISLTGSIQSPNARELSLDFIFQGSNALEPKNIVSPMASNTSSNQIASSSSVYSAGFQPYKAFNNVIGVTNDVWASSAKPTISSPQWISISFLTDVDPIKSYTITNRTSSNVDHMGSPSKWYFQGRNDDTSEWINIEYREDINNIPTAIRDFNLESPVNYKQYRLYITESATAVPYVTIANIALNTELKNINIWDDLLISPDKTVNVIRSNHYYFLDNPVTYRRYRWYYKPLNEGDYTLPYRTVGRVQLYKKIP